MTNAERIIATCHKWLGEGALGNKQRAAAYRKLIACDFSPAITPPFASLDIGTVKTSCAVFVRGILHDAGRPATRPGTVGQGIMGGWLERLTPNHPAWEWATDAAGKRRRPPPGAVFYRDYTRDFGAWGHVGILLFETSPGLWMTAEGGGGDGTECRLSATPKDIFAKDTLNRVPIGWWRPELLDGFTQTAPSAPLPLATFRSVRLGDTDAAGSADGPVRTYQRRLQASGVPGTSLPRYGADGDFGGETFAATKALIFARLDGTLVNEIVWNLVEKLP